VRIILHTSIKFIVFDDFNERFWSSSITLYQVIRDENAASLKQDEESKNRVSNLFLLWTYSARVSLIFQQV